MKESENMKYNFEREKSDYLTPHDVVFHILNKLKIDKFGIDVCCSKTNIPARHHYINGSKDGLKESWKSFDYAFCNPPFEECKKWVIKAYNEHLQGNKSVLLIPARTETKYWHEYILNQPNIEIEFLVKGIRFINAENNEKMGVFKNALAIVYLKGR